LRGSDTAPGSMALNWTRASTGLTNPWRSSPASSRSWAWPRSALGRACATGSKWWKEVVPSLRISGLRSSHPLDGLTSRHPLFTRKEQVELVPRGSDRCEWLAARTLGSYEARVGLRWWCVSLRPLLGGDPAEPEDGRLEKRARMSGQPKKTTSMRRPTMLNA
jgi:hypothetical protein